MSQIVFALTHYLAIVILALFSYQFGRQITRSVKYHSALEEFSFSTALGLGVIAYMVFFLGMFGLLYKTVLVATLVAGSAACYKVWLDLIHRLGAVPSRLKRANKVRLALAVAGILVGVALSIPVLKSPLFPPTSFDATSYHLPAAKIYVQQHRVVFTPYLRFAVFPHTNELLMSLALLFYDDLLAQLVQFLAMTILVCSCIAFGLRFFSARAGWWGAALLVSHPQVLWLGSVAYVDITVTLFVMMNVYAFWNWVETKERSWLVISGACCGLAISVKYTAALFLVLFVVVLLYRAFRGLGFRPVLMFGLTALSVMLPWLARNFYYTHNPVYPFFYKIFGRLLGYGFTSPEDYTGFFTDMSLYGAGKSLKALVLLPWHLTFNPEFFLSRVPFAPYLLFGLPVLVVGAIRNRNVRRLLAVALTFTLFWFYSMQVLRYLVPALPLISIATGASLSELLNWNPKIRRLTTSLFVTCSVGVLLCYTGLNYAWDSLARAGPIPVTARQRDDYLARHLSSYPAYKLLREPAGRAYTIYTIQDENMNYFAEGKFLGDYFGPARYSHILDKLQNGQALYDALKSFGADYFLVNNQRRRIALADDKAFHEHFMQIYSGAGTVLFRISDITTEHDEGIELLVNPGFEDVTDGWPTAWRHTGRPIIDTSGEHSFTGYSAVRCTGADNVFYQVVRVQPGDTYTVNHTARGIGEGSRAARLQVNWSDARGNDLGTFLEVFDLTSEWKRHEATVTAPKQASYAVVYAACEENSSAWMDDFSFMGKEVNRVKGPPKR